MVENTRITVQRTIDAPAPAIFNVLSNPARHAEFDGSGFVRGDDRSDRVTGTGQVFTMNMAGDHMGGDYQTENHVTGFDENRMIAWKTAPAGVEPPGWEWVYDLDAQGPDATEVTITYDWGKVTDKDLLAKISFPLVGKDALEDSLARLAATVAG